MPRISIIHATARVPDGWRPAHDQAFKNCDRPEDVEYLLAVDECDLKALKAYENPGWGSFQVVVNTGLRTSVVAYNEAARQSRGDLLFIMQDDIWCPERWDSELEQVIGEQPGFEGVEFFDPKVEEFVIWVSSGSPRDHELMAPQFLSRARYEACGYVWYPGYLSMYADDDFTKAAVKDGMVLYAKHLLFKQTHPAFGTAEQDEVYRHENREESYRVGLELIQRRELAGFPRKVGDLPELPQRPTIHVCMPGENFSSTYLSNWTVLLTTLMQNFRVRGYFGYNTDVYACRNWFVEQLGLQGAQPHDLVLWMDDDNILRAEDFKKLYEAIQQPDAPDVLAAWCWIYDQPKRQYMVSCGRFDVDGKTRPADPTAWSGAVEPQEYTGFPAVLHRYSVLQKVLQKSHGKPFGHITNVPGEDCAFCTRVANAGMKIGVHTGVCIEHLKRVALMPNLKDLKVERA